MNRKFFAPLSVLLAFGSPGEAAHPKTITPEKINPDLIGDEPYRFNGAVLTENARGSGFCAWNRHTFFTAAHVVFDDSAGKWGQPPIWYSKANSEVLPEEEGIQSRGYYRWTNYADLATSTNSQYSPFARDVALAFSFEKLIKGTPAKINLSGGTDLQKDKPTLITGYPADKLYEKKEIEGYFLHKTGPSRTPYKPYSANALITTKVSTGHGNSGGPIWTKNTKGEWNAAGVLVGGLPSESVVYAFSPDITALLSVAKPTVRPEIGTTFLSEQVGSSSQFFTCRREQKIPDGSHQWTAFEIGVDFPDIEAKLTSVRISLDIRTKHRGDLQVMLLAPGGYQTVIHNEGGAGKDNLIIKDKDVSEAFTGISPRGPWYLMVQDRLKGDVATFKSCVLEVSEDPQSDTTTDP